MKMEQIEGSETSAIINQTPGNCPKGNLLDDLILFWVTQKALNLQSCKGNTAKTIQATKTLGSK